MPGPARRRSSVFRHETGHIFGCNDEYCPDACRLTTVTGGYLGVTNGNAYGLPEHGPDSLARRFAASGVTYPFLTSLRIASGSRSAGLP